MRCSPVSLSVRSPHLFRCLERRFTPGLIQPFEQAFVAVVAANGELEQDFVRPPDVSFNPRPARLVLILLNDCGITDHQLLLAAMLCGCDQETLKVELAGEPYQPFKRENVQALEILRLTQLCSISLPDSLGYSGTALESHKEDIAAPVAAVFILLALLLDRLRHVHQAGDPELARAIATESLTANTIAERLSPKLASLISACQKRILGKTVTQATTDELVLNRTYNSPKAHG